MTRRKFLSTLGRVTGLAAAVAFLPSFLTKPLYVQGQKILPRSGYRIIWAVVMPSNGWFYLDWPIANWLCESPIDASRRWVGISVPPESTQAVLYKPMLLEAVDKRLLDYEDGRANP